MKGKKRNQRQRRELWSHRSTMLGILFVVFCMSLVIGLRGKTLGAKEAEYQQRIAALEVRLEQEEKRSEKLEEQRVYVQTKQYIEEVAKSKLGLVYPDEILLKPKP
ncbi:MAG: septum formation initiator family protein [Lachnospiraceae bacterium]|nr:septum formation initiator family protein [Lachnospiraceae bacterium]